ncbi:hypothetical protein GCM10008955_26330 [Deinococcus malanensis]|uniref:J domain-containing protein n=1 Tax=Deinococcus malanensis TaxID=1706855 RepID=A0ABQ2F1G3_9DEIO|nr:J domain-containing protein [Deinococcus malanensis]GGK31214.1 hypothetical protein GCM10008955_26330 [Deinococcus malanensis]
MLRNICGGPKSEASCQALLNTLPGLKGKAQIPLEGVRMASQDMDRLGYYRLLEVPYTATQEEIKRAYRDLVKKHHPDRNPSPEAADNFRAIVQAYEVVGKAEIRRTYDEWNAEGAVGDAPPEVMPLVACERCQEASPYLRVVGIRWVWSVLLVTRHGLTPRVLCPRCANRHLCAAGIKTALFGWWGFPFGLIQTPRALYSNVTGGNDLSAVTVNLLVHQAAAFYQRGENSKARLARQQAYLVADNQYHLEEEIKPLQQLLGDDPYTVIERPWDLLRTNGLLRVVPLVVAAGLLGTVGAQISADMEQEAAATARCTEQKQGLDQEKNSLTEEAERLETSGEALLSRYHQLEAERAFLEVDRFNAFVDVYNADLADQNAQIERHKSQVEVHNSAISLYNQNCAQ